MKRFLKSSFSIFLAVTIIFSSAVVGLNEIDLSGLFAVKAEAASTSDLTFKLNSDKKSYTVKACNTSAEGSLVIPAEYNGKLVTSISSNAFNGCTSLTSITIPEGVTSIGFYAFEDCTSLTSIFIPDSVTNIGGRAFYNTGYYNDENNWDNGVLYINNHLIAANKYNEENYEYIGNVSGDYIIKSGTKSIAASVFENCTSLTSITIPESVTGIGSMAFSDCTNLKFVYIKDIAAWCGIDFYNATSNPLYYAKNLYVNGELAKDIVIPDSVTSIGSFAFYNCISIASITIPGNVTNIGSYAFYNCDGLTSITILEGVTSIGSYAFCGCSSLDSITIPDSVTNIASEAFTYTKHEQYYATSDEKFYYIGNHLICARSVRNAKIKEGTITIADGAFSNITSLESVTIPDSVTNMGDGTFSFCERLKKVTIGKGVTKIGYGVFSKCEWLDSVTIPDNITYIDEAAFENCRSLKSIVIPATVTHIGADAFYGCSNLKTVKIFNERLDLTETELGYYYDYDAYKVKKVKGLTIYGLADSTAEKYAKETGFNFKEIARPATVKLNKVANTTSGVKITWGKVKGADSYNVYRKTKSGSYNKIGSTKNTYYTDKKAKSGKRYYYIVKAVDEGVSSSASKAKSILHLADPTLKSVSNSKYGVRISWNKVSGAEKYNVYRKTSSGFYSKVGTTKKTYYTDKKAKSGRKYYYIVKAVKGSATSASSSAKSILHLADPTLKTPSSTKSGITLKWTKVTGAQGYIICRKTGSGSYTKIKTEKGVSNLSYTDKSAKKGKTYTYKIKAYKSKTYSAYSNAKKIKDRY